MGVVLERRKMGVESAGAMVGGVAGDEPATWETRQDHDSEERGMLRRGSDAVDDIELQDFGHASLGRTGGDEDRERDELLRPDGGRELQDCLPWDHFYTGEHVVANLHIIDTIRAQWNSSGGSIEGSGAATTSASDVQAAAVAAMTRGTLTFRTAERDA